MASIQEQVLTSVAYYYPGKAPWLTDICNDTGILPGVVAAQLQALLKDGSVYCVDSPDEQIWGATRKGRDLARAIDQRFLPPVKVDEPAPLPGMTPEEPAEDDSISHVCLPDDTFDPWWYSLDLEVKARVFQNFYIDAAQEPEAAHA